MTLGVVSFGYQVGQDDASHVPANLPAAFRLACVALVLINQSILKSVAFSKHVLIPSLLVTTTFIVLISRPAVLVRSALSFYHLSVVKELFLQLASAIQEPLSLVSASFLSYVVAGEFALFLQRPSLKVT